ncbi:hypothetical protein [Mariniflexile sp.]|uniref:hypothetical protein n=1 Tax=Mariniflexile sp. TaxID=1979402 RepID=UPI0040474056
MKNALFTCICVLVMGSCKDNAEAQAKEGDKIVYKSFGKEIIAVYAIQATSMATHYKSMQVGDSKWKSFCK